MVCVPLTIRCFSQGWHLLALTERTRAAKPASKTYNARRKQEKSINLALLLAITNCWCRRGHWRRSKAPGKKQKCSEAGRIHWVSGKQCWATGDCKNTALFRSDLSQVLELSARTPERKTSVIIDHQRIHFIKPVLALLAAHSEEIEPVIVPPYRLWPNLVNRFWKHLPCKVTYQSFFKLLIGCSRPLLPFLRMP